MDTKMDNPARMIAILHNMAHIFWAGQLEGSGLSVAEHPVMFLLYQGDGLTQEEISRRLLVDKSAVTRALQSLEGKGMVERRKDEKDRRCNRIFLTNRAEVYRNQVESSRTSWNETLQRGMTEEERQTFSRLLKKAAENVKEWNASCQ